MENGKLSISTKVSFGICDLGGNLFFTVVGIFLLKFFTDTIGLEPGLAGLAIGLGRIWDAVTDPAVGALSDRTRTRWGRRRPYMFVGAILLFFSMIYLFTNPALYLGRDILTQTFLFLWATFAYCFLNLAYTLVSIPYGALTPELTKDRDEQTSLNGYRMTFAAVGTLFGIAMGGLTNGFTDKNMGWLVLGIILGVVMLVTALITVIRIKEPPRPVGEKTKGEFDLKTLPFKEFLTILFPWTFHITGITILMASIPFYFSYIYRFQGAELSIALLSLILSAIVCIPLWVTIARHIGKKASYNIGMSLFALSVLIFFVFGESLGFVFACIMMVIAGVGFSTQYAIPFALIPEVVELDYARNGIRREGIYYGLWTFMSKLGGAGAAAFAGLLLEAFGYIKPTASVAMPEQTALTKLVIKLLAGPIPAGFFVLGVLVLLLYPISKKVYAEILEKIRVRESGARETDPSGLGLQKP